jgi:hypothetical protein
MERTNSYSDDDRIIKVGKSSNVVEDTDSEFESGMIYVNAKSRSK